MSVRVPERPTSVLVGVPQVLAAHLWPLFRSPRGGEHPRTVRSDRDGVFGMRGA